MKKIKNLIRINQFLQQEQIYKIDVKTIQQY